MILIQSKIQIFARGGGGTYYTPFSESGLAELKQLVLVGINGKRKSTLRKYKYTKRNQCLHLKKRNPDRVRDYVKCNSIVYIQRFNT